LNYARDTTSGQEGLQLLEKVRERAPDLPVVAMTAWGTIELAVEAIRLGARDFVEKPWDNDRLLSIVANQLALAAALRKSRGLEAENRLLRGEGATDFVAQSRAMQPVLEMIDRVGPSDANVLITGENGTGKGLVARLLHACSPRSGKPLVTVNVGGLAATVFESELFGHVRGAFTDAKTDRVGRFELADGGTLFLDEIANVPLPQQTKLLRVLESGEFEPVGSSRTRSADARLLTATNADLATEVGEGRFRRDLYFRVRTVEIPLPPLRDRREDLLPLAERFRGAHAHRYRKEVAGFDAAAVRAIERHSWPGNVRELDHAVERAVLLARGAKITAVDLGLEGTPSSRGLEEMTLEEVEEHLIKKALDRYAGNVSQAASALGLSRSALYRRLEKHGRPPEPEDPD
ncbi:MAG TPA: sigma-54 dependent transcriptional regulator, partial [Thermoanaerobaculia bacterium]|nr:sigma-54 dependent transcriptional regulator [Thermoanaerobaculia bacterium]